MVDVLHQHKNAIAAAQVDRALGMSHTGGHDANLTLLETELAARTHEIAGATGLQEKLGKGMEVRTRAAAMQRLHFGNHHLGRARGKARQQAREVGLVATHGVIFH